MTDYLKSGSVKLMTSLEIGLYVCPYFETHIVHTFHSVHTVAFVSQSEAFQ